MVDVASLVQFSFNGLALGSIIALAAVGLTLVYGILQLPNFAHGDFLTAGAYLTFFFVSTDFALAEASAYALGLGVLLVAAAAWDQWRSHRLAAEDRGLFLVLGVGLLVLGYGVTDGMSWRPGVKVLVPVALVAAIAGLGMRNAKDGVKVAALGGAGAGVLAGIMRWPTITQGILDPLPFWAARLLIILTLTAGGAALAAAVVAGVGRLLDARLGERRRPVHGVVAGGVVAAAGAAWVNASVFVLAIGLAMAGVAALAAAFELAVWRPLRTGRLHTGSHVLLGGFVGLLVGLALAEAFTLASWTRLLTLLGAAAVGAVASHRFLGTRSVPPANLVTYIVASIGVAFVIRYTILLWFTGSLRTFPLPSRVAQPILGVIVPFYQRATILTAIVVLSLVWVLLRYSRFGKAVRALADNLTLARVTGIDVDRVVLKVWLLAGALTGLAGVLLAFTAGTFTPELGWRFLLLMFSAVILGGIGSVPGSLLGGFAIGLTTELSVLLFDSRYKLAAAFLVLILILLVRPQGFFGVVER